MLLVRLNEVVEEERERTDMNGTKTDEMKEVARCARGSENEVLHGVMNQGSTGIHVGDRLACKSSLLFRFGKRSTVRSRVGANS